MTKTRRASEIASDKGPRNRMLRISADTVALMEIFSDTLAKKGRSDTSPTDNEVIRTAVLEALKARGRA
jgi:hypothetical protein